MIDRDKFVIIFEQWAETMKLHRDYLIELDSVVGDGDLGLTMSDGFAAAAANARNNPENDIGMLLYSAGKAMAQAVPSTMGTLMASGLMNAGKYGKGRLALDLKDFADCMEALLQGIMNRGKARPGDKTIIDGLLPAVEALKLKAQHKALWTEALEASAGASRLGFRQTAQMVAVHGRAATRGEASRSLLDPGAAVAMLLMEGLSRVAAALEG